MLLRLYGRRLRLARKLKSEQLDDLVQELCCYIRDHESDLRIKNPDYMAVVMRIWNMTPIRELRTCTECGHVHPADTTLRVANNGRICQRCRPLYMRDNGQWVHFSRAIHYEYSRPNAGDVESSFFNTQKEERGLRKGNKKPGETLLYMGVELEVEARAAYREHPQYQLLQQAVTASVPTNFAYCKYDGSLGPGGFEICTAPATLKYHRVGQKGMRSPWKGFFEGPARYLKGRHTDTAAIHIHVSRNALGLLQLGKIIAFYEDRQNFRQLLRPLFERDANRYCELYGERLPRGWHKARAVYLDCSEHDDRYYAVNMHNEDTVEFRSFKSHISFAALMKDLELIHSLIYYCDEESLAHLHWKRYLEWLQVHARNYPWLVNWLVHVMPALANGHDWGSTVQPRFRPILEQRAAA